jgi:tellurite resistance protein TerC
VDWSYLFMDWLGKPLWLWLAFFVVVFVLLVFDLGILNRKDHDIEVKESLALSTLYIALGLGFGAWVWWYLGSDAGMNYLTGFVVEKALALDNIFVIAMAFTYFAVPRMYQHRVLFWGILGVIVLRAIMIGFGAAIVSNFSWVLYVFAVFLIATGIKMLILGNKEKSLDDNAVIRFMRQRFRVTDRLHGNRFFVRLRGKSGSRPLWHVTPLFMALIFIEVADVIFAVDSVPAIFAITSDPFIVYTSNIFAILGLRALYFALAAMIHRFEYLKIALSLVLVFIGSKIFIADIFGLAKFPPLASLSITLGLLAGGVLVSLWRPVGKG